MRIVIDLTSAGPFHSMPKEWINQLQASLPRHEFISITHEELDQAIGDTDVVLAYNIPRETFLKASKLKMIIYAVDGIGPMRLYQEIINSDVQIINSKGCRSQAIAEHAFALTLTLTRKIYQMSTTLTKEGWWGNSVIQPSPPTEIFGKTLGILGLGEIGKRIAKIGKLGFGMRVIGMKRTIQPVENVDEVVDIKSMETMLNQSDVLVITLPETETTKGIIGKFELSKIKAGSYLVNISRGSVINEKSLVLALQSGLLAGAGLDVFEQEPLPDDSPLRALPNVILTPHAAGVTNHFWERFVPIIKENILRLEAGLTLLNVTDKVLGY